MERLIVWNKRPSQFLSKALKRISQDSVVQAEMIEKELLSAINKLPQYPEMYPPDKFKKSNPLGMYRAFELLNFRISYAVAEKQIRILRIRHVKQQPKYF